MAALWFLAFGALLAAGGFLIFSVLGFYFYRKEDDGATYVCAMLALILFWLTVGAITEGADKAAAYEKLKMEKQYVD
jgi:ABC-type Fe3+ transport system permease subunit